MEGERNQKILMIFDDNGAASERFLLFQELQVTIVNRILESFDVVEVDQIETLVAAAKAILNKILESITVLCENENCLDTLREYLDMCINILCGLHSFLEQLIRRNKKCYFAASYLSCITPNIQNVLLSTFEHCNHSETIYGKYFSDLGEILKLFKTGQSLYETLLCFLTTNARFESAEDDTLLSKVTQNLALITNVLCRLNVKAMSDGWKAYMTLTQKYIVELREGGFSISETFPHLRSQISEILKEVIDMDGNDKKLNPSMKVLNFLVKVVLKLCETFWANLDRFCSKLLEFLAAIYRFHPLMQNYQNGVKTNINSTLFVPLDAIFVQLAVDAALLELKIGVISSSCLADETGNGFLLALLVLFGKIIQQLPPCDISIFIDVIFAAVKQNYAQMFRILDMSPILDNHTSFYDYILIDVCRAVLQSDNEQFNKVEIVLLKNVLDGGTWNSLLAVDVWSTVLRHKPRQLCHSTLCTLIDQSRSVLPDALHPRPEHNYLENLLLRLYKQLNYEHKLSVMARYATIDHLWVWKILGTSEFPPLSTFNEVVTLKLVDEVEALYNGEIEFDGLVALCNCLEVLPSANEEIIMNLWNNPEQNIVFSALIESLCVHTSKELFNYNPTTINMILLKLKSFVPIAKTQVLLFLTTVSDELAKEGNQLFITTNNTILADIFSDLLQDRNPIFVQQVLEVFEMFISNSHLENLIHHVICTSSWLEPVLSKYLQNQVDVGTVSRERYFEMQGKDMVEVKWPCMTNSSCVDDEVGVLVDKIDQDVVELENDVGQLRKLGVGSLSEENVASLYRISDRLRQLL